MSYRLLIQLRRLLISSSLRQCVHGGARQRCSDSTRSHVINGVNRWVIIIGGIISEGTLPVRGRLWVFVHVTRVRFKLRNRRWRDVFQKTTRSVGNDFTSVTDDGRPTRDRYDDRGSCCCTRRRQRCSSVRYVPVVKIKRKLKKKKNTISFLPGFAYHAKAATRRRRRRTEDDRAQTIVIRAAARRNEFLSQQYSQGEC